MKESNGLLMLGVGAALMYFFDPQAGRRRRALVRDQYAHTVRKIQEAERVVVRDASQRASGLIAQANRMVKRDGANPDDVVLTQRVRSALGRAVSHPHAVEAGGADGLGGAVQAVGARQGLQRAGQGALFLAGRGDV